MSWPSTTFLNNLREISSAAAFEGVQTKMRFEGFFLRIWVQKKDEIIKMYRTGLWEKEKKDFKDRRNEVGTRIDESESNGYEFRSTSSRELPVRSPRRESTFSLCRAAQTRCTERETPFSPVFEQWPVVVLDSFLCSHRTSPDRSICKDNSNCDYIDK